MADDNQNNENQNLTDQQKQNRKDVEQALEIFQIDQKRNKLLNDINNAKGIEKDLLEKQLSLLEATVELEEAKNKGNEESAKIIQERLNALEEETKELEKQNKLREQGLEIGRNFANELFSVNNRILQQSLRIGSVWQAAGESITGLIGEFDSFRKVATLGFDKILGATAEQITALDGAAASFVQATGASRDFAYSAFQTRNELGLLGITGIDATETMAGLYGTFSEFTQLSPGARQDFTVLAAQIDKLGGNAAGMSQVFTKVANSSLPETTRNLRLVAGAADALGIPLQQMSNDIESVSELFAKMGQAGMDTFLELSAVSKSTGLSVRELYDIVSQYDTFDNATQAAGRLNMVLGGNLIDTYSLLNATEEERIEMLQNALALSGQTFDEMDRFQRREISDALNISLDEAAKLFQTTTEEVRKTAAELMHAGMTQEELEERTQDASTAMDKFKVLMGNVALAVAPLVELVNFLVDAVLSFVKPFGAIGGAVGALVVSLGAGYLAFKLFGVGLGIAFKTAAGTISATAPAISAGLASIGAGAGAASIGVGAFALGVLAIGASVFLAAAGLALFVSQFKEMTPQQILETSFALGVFTASIVAMSVAMAGLGALGPVALIGMGVLVASFAGIVLAINALNETKVQSFATALSSIIDLAKSPLQASGVPAFIKEISSALDDLPDNQTKLVNFATTADSLTNLMRVSANVEEAKLENIRMIIEGVSSSEGNENIGRLADAINSLIGNQNAADDKPIVIELDSRVLGRWVDRRTGKAIAKVAS